MSITTASTLKLNTGANMPILGLGTWKSAPGAVKEAVRYALQEAGYKHIDTATAYGNETEVGEGIALAINAGVAREDIFITTKLDNDCHNITEEAGKTTVAQALENSLNRLGTGYLDLWLMHWPAPMLTPPSSGKPDPSGDWVKTWKEMGRLYKAEQAGAKRIRAIGVSNFSVKYLTQLLAEPDVIVPAVNQIELHPSLPQKEIVDFCTKHNIVLTAYSPLGSDASPLLTNEIVVEISKKYEIDPAAVLISFQAAHDNRTVLPKSVTASRIKSNVQLAALTPEEVQKIASIGETHQFRVCDPRWAKNGDLGFTGLAPRD